MALEFSRRTLLRRIGERLETTPLVAITGPRGCGKTRLLEALRATHEEGAVLLQLEPLASTPEILEREVRRLAGAVLPRRRDRASAFESLLDLLRRRAKGSLLLLDDFTELRTLSYFPGVEEPLEQILDALGRRGPTVISSRLGYWVRRELPELPRIEIPPLTASELEEAGVAEADAEDVCRATAGHVVHAARLAETMAKEGLDVAEALFRELSPGGRIEAECRATLAELLHRARGYNACKAVLRVLTEQEGLKLTEVARRIERTAGSTRDYLRWLEEVDLIRAVEKRFSFVDPVLRLWMRTHGRGTLPSEATLRSEIERYLGRRELATPVDEVVEPYVLPATKREDLVEID